MAGFRLIIGNRAYSSWSLRAWLCLKATGADFEEDVIPLFEPGSAERVCAISPAGQVPILVDGDIVIPDSLAIAEYLAEAFPAAGLWPEDKEARAAARSACAEMHAGFRSLRAGLPMNLRKHLPGVADIEAARADIDRICRIWRGCRERFGTGGPFLFGRFGNADAFYAPVASRFDTYGVELDDLCRGYVAAVMEMPTMAEWREGALREPWIIDRVELG